jgi:hypothetical protein
MNGKTLRQFLSENLKEAAKTHQDEIKGYY